MHLRMLGQGAQHAFFTQQGNGRGVGPGKCQHVDDLTIRDRSRETDKPFCCQITALFIVTHQAADETRIARWQVTENPDLVRGQRIVDGKQLDPAAHGHTQDFRGDIQLIGKQQVIRALVPLQRRSRQIEQLAGVALGKKYFQRHAGGVGSRLHDPGITLPIIIGCCTGAQKYYRGGVCRPSPQTTAQHQPASI